MNDWSIINSLYAMNRNLHMLLVAAPTLAVLFFGQAMSYAQDANEVIDYLKNRYDDVTLVRTGFTQKATSPFGESLPQNQGTVILQGNKYRVESGTQTFVTDGVTTWIYDSF